LEEGREMSGMEDGLEEMRRKLLDPELHEVEFAELVRRIKLIESMTKK